MDGKGWQWLAVVIMLLAWVVIWSAAAIGLLLLSSWGSLGRTIVRKGVLGRV